MKTAYGLTGAIQGRENIKEITGVFTASRRMLLTIPSYCYPGAAKLRALWREWLNIASLPELLRQSSTATKDTLQKVRVLSKSSNTHLTGSAFKLSSKGILHRTRSISSHLEPTFAQWALASPTKFQTFVPSSKHGFLIKVCSFAARQCSKTSSATISLPMVTDLPKTFSDILAYLLKHHMLQLYTNSLAVITVVSDQHERNSGKVCSFKLLVFIGQDSKFDIWFLVVATTSQRRVAACIFPCISLMNHSCDSNTILSFCGNKVKVSLIASS